MTALEIRAATDKMGDSVEEPKKGKKAEKRKTQMRECPRNHVVDTSGSSTPPRPPWVARARALARPLAAPGRAARGLTGGAQRRTPGCGSGSSLG